MKISFISLSTLVLSGSLISAVSFPTSFIPAHGNAEYGPADPLTLAMRVEALRQSIYGEENLTTQSTQSNAQEQAQIGGSSAGCGSNCKSTLSFAGSGESIESLRYFGSKERARITTDWASIFSPSILFKAVKAFEVGNNIPGIRFKTKNSWAGNLPIAKSTDREVRGRRVDPVARI